MFTYAHPHPCTCTHTHTHTHTHTQLLRSSAEWSAGIPVEHSIMNAWISAINKSEHFIYIEVHVHVLGNKEHTNKFTLGNTYNYFSPESR